MIKIVTICIEYPENIDSSPFEYILPSDFKGSAIYILYQTWGNWYQEKWHKPESIFKTCRKIAKGNYVHS